MEERRGEEQLSLRRQRAAAVPAAPAVEELRAARPWQRQEVLGVGDCRRERAERRRIGGAASGGEERDRSEAARELEGAAREVAVRDGIAGEVRREAEPDRGSARARRGPERRPDRRVERDDHRRWALLLVLLLFVPALVAPAPAAADDGGTATYTARGATYDFALRNTGTTAWQYFAVVAPPGASFVGGTTAVEGSARCVVGPPDTITCGPLSTFGFAPGSSMEFTAVLQSPIACGAPFGFSVSTTGAQPFTRVGDAVFTGSCAPPRVVRVPRLHRAGAVVTITPPLWSTPPEEISYAWQRCTGARCIALRGATGLLRIRTTHRVRAVVVATFADGTVLRSVTARV